MICAPSKSRYAKPSSGRSKSTVNPPTSRHNRRLFSMSLTSSSGTKAAQEDGSVMEDHPVVGGTRTACSCLSQRWEHNRNTYALRPGRFQTVPPDIFETARLVMRPIGIADVDPIFESYAQDDEVTRYLIWRPHRSRSETEAYVRRCVATPPEVERTYTLVGSDDGAVRGAFAL